MALHKMTKADEKHLQRVKDWVCARIDAKYRRGKEEHGGSIWQKPLVLEMLFEELIDAVVYGEVLDEQQTNPFMINPKLHDKK